MSGYLLDTNVISEIAQPQPDAGVCRFVGGLDDACLSTLTIHELSYGLELLPADSRRKAELVRKIEELLGLFHERILPITDTESRIAGAMRADAKKTGRVVHTIDALIAATAFAHDLTVVTRNEKDFQDLGVRVFNPWVKAD